MSTTTHADAAVSPQSGRRLLISLNLFLGVTAVGGGLALLLGWIHVPTSNLAGSPFSDYTIPAILLTVVIGGTGLAAAALTYLRLDDGLISSGIAAGAIVIFEGVEWSIIGFSPLQVAYMALGAAILVVALRIRVSGFVATYHVAA